MVDQLMEVERIPQQRLRAEQQDNTKKKDALDLLATKLSTLNTRVSAFSSGSLFHAKSVGLANESLGITANVSTSATEGKYDFNVTQLATATKRFGSEDVGGSMGDAGSLISSLRLATDISEGTFTVNGQEVTVAATDTLQDVFDAISAATGGVVTGSYDSLTDKVALSSASGQLELGASDDASNFLSALKLDQLEVTDAGGGASQVVSSGALGVVDLDVAIASSGLSGPITGSGTFNINGVAIDFDADTESMQALMSRVNKSAAGVTMSYDSANDSFRIVNNKTGAYSMPVIDSGNGVLAALGVTGVATVGDDMQFTVDGGATISSRSNTLTSAEHGIEGLTINAAAEGLQTVTVSRNSDELKTKIDEFIAAYNDVQDFIAEKTKIEVKDDKVTAATLAGNREISSLDSQLRRMAFGAIEGMSGNLFRLEHLGIDFQSGTSKLEIKDSDALTSALQNDVETLEEFFMGDSSTSFSGRLKSFIDNFTDTNGVVKTQAGNLTKRNSSIDTQIAEMERRIEFKRSALEASFIAMETAQQNINNMSQALSSLNFNA